MIDLERLLCEELDQNTAKQVNIAVDIAENILMQSIDFAQNVIDPTMGRLRYEFAMVHAQITTKIYQARININNPDGVQ